MQQQQVLHFGSYRLERDNEQLWQGKRRIRLTRKAFLVLCQLADQQGQLITKETLFAAVWPESVVSDGALSRCIQELRKALGDSAKTPQYIETVHGRGFRFIAPIRSHAASSPSSTLQEQSPALPLPDKPSIAVLPFTNMSNDPEQEYFSDGLTEDVITDLAQLSGLFVIAYNSVFAYKGKAVKIGDVGRELGVRYVLEGSVRKVDDRVRITAQLIDAATGGHVWAQRYDRALADVFSLQEEVSQKIVTALAVHITPGEHARLMRRDTDNLEAYETFWRAEAAFWRLTKNDYHQAQQLYQRAITLDPQYATAYGAFAHARYIAWAMNWNGSPKTLDQAMELALQALTLDPDQVAAHHALSGVHWWRGQHEQAIAVMKRSVIIAPSDAYGHLCVGHLLSKLGQPEEAIREVEIALRLNPQQPPFYLYYLGQAYKLAQRYEEARTIHQRVLARMSVFWPSHLSLAVIYSELGQQEAARAAVAEVLRINPEYSLAEKARERVLYKNPEVLDRELRALRHAGLE